MRWVKTAEKRRFLAKMAAFRPFPSHRPVSGQLAGEVPLQQFGHGEQDDGAPLLIPKPRHLPLGILGIAEAHEEALLAFRPAHGGLEGVHVRPPGLVLLLHLDGEPLFFQREFDSLAKPEYQ